MCSHPIQYLQMTNRGVAHYLICHKCGKEVPISDDQSFIWMKLLELTQLVGQLAARTTDNAVTGGF